MASYRLEELAKKTKCQLIGSGTCVISGVADLENASAEEISFLANTRYLPALKLTKAACVVVSADVAREENKNYLISDNPSKTFQELIELFLGEGVPVTHFTGIHETAVIHPTAKVGSNAKIGPHVVIDGEVVLGNNCHIGAGTSIGPNVKIGNDVTIYPNVVIREGCTIGNRVVIQPGAVIGSCGYGFTTDKKGEHSKLNQLGNVVIDDDVEIGANTTIDRARFKSTRIGQGTKVDNLVQIAHGVVIGKHSLIIAQTGIAGSAQIGNHVILAGKVAVNGHITIGDQVVVAACSGISKSILKPGRYAGVPVMELAEHNKNQVLLRNIDKYIDELKTLKEELAKLK